MILTLGALTVFLVCCVGVYSQVIVGIVEKDMGEILLKASNRGQYMLQNNIADGFERLHGLTKTLADADLQDETLAFRPELASGDDSWFVVTDLNGGTVSAETGLAQDLGVKILQQGLGYEERLTDFQTLDPSSEESGIVFLVPIKKDEIVKGVLAGFYNTGDISMTMETPMEDGRLSCYLITKDGKGVVWSRKGENPMGFSLTSSFGDEVFLNANPLVGELAQAMKDQGSGVIHTKDPDGNRVYISFAETGVQDWYFISVAQTDLIHQKSAEITKLVWLVGGVLTVVMLGLVFFVVAGYHQKGSTMEQEVLFDKLTGISNWKNIEAIAKQHPFNNAEYACLVFNIRNFKRVNALFGFEEGGKILRAIGQTVMNFIGEDEHTCRVSGDNFAVFLRYDNQDELTRRIDELFAKLEVLDVQEDRSAFNYNCSYRGGICLMKDLETGQGVVDARDRAIMILESQPPHVPTSCWGYFDEAARAELLLRQELEKDIVRAFNEKEFVPYFQAQYQTTTDEIFGAEVLARWNHPQKGIIMPKHFLPVLERAGCILDLDMSMLEGACRCLKGWIDQGLLPVPITVNISRLNLHRKDFVRKVRLLVDNYQVPTNLLAFELDEKTLNEDLDKIQAVVEELKSFGFQIIMDDSGVGKVAVEVFQRLTLDSIKVNKEFLLKAEEGEKDRQILLNLLRMTKDLGITIIAKYVETSEQMQILQKMGCDYMQGKLFAEPLNEEAFVKLVFNNSRE